MDSIKEWLKEQWGEKKFRIFFLLTFLLMIGLGIEFYLFQYAITKCCRYLSLVISLFVIAWIDSKEKRIPNRILLAMLIIRAVILVLECILFKDYLLSMLLSAGAGFLIAGGMFLFCYLISRGGIGAGDVKLFSVLGFYMGASSIFSVIFLTVVFAAFFNIVNLIRKKTDLKQEIPFAPFVFWGTAAAMMLGM